MQKNSAEPPWPHRTQGPFSPATTTHESQSAWKLMVWTRNDCLPPLTTSPAHISWVNQGLWPALQQLQTQGKGYGASQGHKLAWGAGVVASCLGLDAPRTHPVTTMRNKTQEGLAAPSPSEQTSWVSVAQRHPQVPLAYAERNSWENSTQPHCRLMVKPTVIAWWGA